VWYVRSLEEAMIRATTEFGINATRVPGKTGLWVGQPGSEQKLAAIGVHISRWVTSHGFAYNVATDLRYFELIVPCGIADRKATSLEKLLGRNVSLGEIKPLFAKHLGEVFGLTIRTATREALFEKLQEFEQALPVPA
jgi:lipoate-protein ligase B